jgi:hypothetical protein
MKITRILALAISVLLVGALAGCAKVPTDKVDAANASVQQAREAGAENYARDSYAQAEQALAAMNEEIKAQEGKFALFRSYGKVNELAAQAQTAGETAKNDAASGKEQARGEAQSAIEMARASVDSTQTLLNKAPRGKGSAADVEMMRQDLMTAQTSISEADSAFAAEDYITAKAKADAAMQSAQSVQNSLSSAQQMETTTQ